jgi:hypothetical protein
MMRSFENRPDTKVVDEPLYAYFLESTGIEHPGREEVLATGQTSWQAIVAELTAPTQGIFYQKHMTHHLTAEVPRGWIKDLTNILLIRDPAEVVSSYVRSRPQVTDEDIGLAQQVELHQLLGSAAPIIDSTDFLRDPEGYLRFMCRYIGVDFTDRMLHWAAGPRDTDGVWAKYWYDAVIASTGFEPYVKRPVEVPGAQIELVKRSRPLYERLRAARVVL